MSSLRGPSWLRTLALGALACLAAGYVTFEIAMWIHPTMRPDGHKTMALGHAIYALGAGSAAGLLAMIADYRWQRRHRRH